MAGLREAPGPGVRVERRIDARHVLDTAPDDFRERELPLACDPLRLAVKDVGQLYLCFYHDGIMPSSGRAAELLAFRSTQLFQLPRISWYAAYRASVERASHEKMWSRSRSAISVAVSVVRYL